MSKHQATGLWQIWIDCGGTFTDESCIDPGRADCGCEDRHNYCHRRTDFGIESNHATRTRRYRSNLYERQLASSPGLSGNRSRGGLQKNQTLSSGRQLGHSRRSRVIFNTRPELNVREKSRGYVMRMNFKTLLSKSFRTYAHINSLPKMSIRQLANQYSSFNYSQLSRKN